MESGGFEESNIAAVNIIYRTFNCWDLLNCWGATDKDNTKEDQSLTCESVLILSSSHL